MSTPRAMNGDSRDPASVGWSVLPLSSDNEEAAVEATRAALNRPVTGLGIAPMALHLWNDEHDRMVSELAGAESPIALGFSGGTDSMMLAHDLHAVGARVRLFCLAVSDDARDARSAIAEARQNGWLVELVLVTDDELNAVVDELSPLLGPLTDTTQRVLAITESLLLRTASRLDAAELWTGHGPEAILGGFHRKPIPDPDDAERMMSSLELNARRLNAVARAHEFLNVTLVHPFFHPRLLVAARALRAAGLTHRDLAGPDAPAKASLQNGSGVHYQLERLARAEGFRALGAWFAHRLDTPVPSRLDAPVLSHLDAPAPSVPGGVRRKETRTS